MKDNARVLNQKSGEQADCFWNKSYPSKLDDKKNGDEVVDDLARQIANTVLVGEKRLCIIAHNHGSSVVSKALKKLSTDTNQQLHDNLEVYTFGEVTHIEKSYAKKVGNYTNSNDFAVRPGKLLWSKKAETHTHKTSVRNLGSGHDFIEGYSDLAATKVKGFVSRNHEVNRLKDENGTR